MPQPAAPVESAEALHASESSPLEYRADVALWSLVMFVVLVSAAILLVKRARRGHAQPSVLIAATGLIVGMVAWPLLAIVSAILLAGLLISQAIRSNREIPVEESPSSQTTLR